MVRSSSLAIFVFGFINASIQNSDLVSATRSSQLSQARIEVTKAAMSFSYWGSASAVSRNQRSLPSSPTAVKRPVRYAPVSMPMRPRASSTPSEIVWP
jgi:hypothetical protein